MTQIYIDESGFTGADYCNLDQPLYVLACSWFDPDFATSIEQPLLDRFRHNELKFSKLIKSVKGKEALIGTIEAIANSEASKQYAVSVVHKPSALVRKFVLDCIEPFFHEAGTDMLKDGLTLG